MALIIPANYDPHLTVRETQEAIKYIRDTFQKEFGKEMHLERIPHRCSLPSPAV